MSAEVTYAAIKFAKPSRAKPETSTELQPTDDHEVSTVEFPGEAENRRGKVERTADVAESTTGKGHGSLWKLWCPFAFIFLMMNVAVLAGLGALFIWKYPKTIMCNEMGVGILEDYLKDMENNLTSMMKNILSEHIQLKNETYSAISFFTNLTQINADYFKRIMCKISVVEIKGNCSECTAEKLKSLENTCSFCKNDDN